VNTKEVIFSISLVDIVSQAFLRIRQFLAKVLVLLLNLLWRLLDEFVLSLDLGK
jgi:hypothetical protein